ncbi:hypothetical protein QOZ80_1BG0060140 [Eleusine coracana subsp. coracana]|nr:hypothetical protein QOZ80_1BG0060140 [Eleusine coracana subsp. coracana]
MEAVHRRLKELGVKYVERRVEEGGIFVDQVFFHDPDGFMIEVCTCDNLPIVPLVPDGYDILRLPHPAPPPPVCKRPSPPLPVPAAAVLPPPPPMTPAPPAQCVPAMASSGSYVVGEVEAIRSCPDRAPRVHAGLMIHSQP